MTSLNNTDFATSARSIDVAIAINEIILECGSRGGSAYVAPTKDFRVHVMGDWVLPIAPQTPKAKRQDLDDVHPARPDLEICNPLSTCFEGRDHLLRDCLINASDDRAAIVECYRDHSNGLAEYCLCSDHDAGFGYPVQSDADMCFIGCRADFLECSNVNGDCGAMYSKCMTTHLAPATSSNPQEELRNCDPETDCFRDCDFGLKDCLLDAGRDVSNATNCWTEHTTCAAQSCRCDDTTNQDGYPILSKAGTCLKWAHHGLVNCQVGNTCEADFVSTIQNCMGKKQVAKRDTRTLVYADQKDGEGRKLAIPVENGVCQTITWTMVGSWVSVVMPGGVKCGFYGIADCWADYDYCEASSSLAVYSCNLGWTAERANSVRCWW